MPGLGSFATEGCWSVIDYNARLNRLREVTGAKAIALVPGATLFYFTGLEFHLSERPVIALVTQEDLSFIIPTLEVSKLQQRPDLDAQAFAWGDTEGYKGAFQQAVETLGLHGQTLGVDGLTMRVTEWLAFQQIDPSIQVKALEGEIVRILARKAPDEVAAMRKAITISEGALEEVMAWVQPGMTERQIATRLTEAMNARGSQGIAFEPLIQTGPNSALPHGMLTDRALGADELLLIDFGGRFAGYPADITRTYCLGTPSAEMQRMYEVVLAANQAATAVAGPGVAMGTVDKAARDVIEAAGYGEYFTHRTGHGLGLNGHETIPQIAAGVADVLEPGMAFTIEPGIYIPGLGGVRIEDNVLVTETGLDVLTTYPRRLSRT
jgi:Xaa-Pro dipeptidase